MRSADWPSSSLVERDRALELLEDRNRPDARDTVSASVDERSLLAETTSDRAASAARDASVTLLWLTLDETTRDVAPSFRRNEIACAPLPVVVVQLPSRSCSRDTQGFEVDGLTTRWSIVTLPTLELPRAAAALGLPEIDAD